MKRIFSGVLLLAFAMAGPASAATVIPQWFSFDMADPEYSEHLVTLETNTTDGLPNNNISSAVYIFDVVDDSLAMKILPTVEAIDGNIVYEPTNIEFDPGTNGAGVEYAPGLGEAFPDNDLEANVFQVGFDGDSFSWIIQSGVLTVNFTNNGNAGSFTIANVSAVPIPAAGIMLASALAGLLVVGRRGRGRADKDAVEPVTA